MGSASLIRQAGDSCRRRGPGLLARSQIRDQRRRGSSLECHIAEGGMAAGSKSPDEFSQVAGIDIIEVHDDIRHDDAGLGGEHYLTHAAAESFRAFCAAAHAPVAVMTTQCNAASSGIHAVVTGTPRREFAGTAAPCGTA